jgi:glycine cleavage system aminomethyltransferase T
VIDIPGAVPASGIDAGVAWHYGEPLQESRALEEGRAFADLSHLGVVTVAGPDRLSWLHGIGTQDLEGLAPGHSTETMILDRGRIRHAAAVVDDGEATHLITETAASLVPLLGSLRRSSDVAVSDSTRSWAVLGDSTDALALVSGRPAWADPWPKGVGPSHPASGWRWRLTLVPRESLASAVRDAAASGLRPVGTWATEANRIAAWRPRALAEARPPVFPSELAWLRTAVRPDQAQPDQGAHRLVFLHLDGSGHLPLRLPAAVALDGSKVGRVTSAALHHDDGPIALALVRRRTDPGAAVTVVGSDGEAVAASQTPIGEPLRGDRKAE